MGSLSIQGRGEEIPPILEELIVKQILSIDCCPPEKGNVTEIGWQDFCIIFFLFPLSKAMIIGWL